MDKLLKQLSNDLFQHLHTMDDEANTPSGCNPRAGLIDYANYVELSGRKYEDAWNNRLAELLADKNTTTSRELRYPNDSRKKCDIVIQKDDIRIWLETKSAWKYWYSSKTGKLEKNPPSIYRSYLFGNLINGLSKSHSVAQDIEKLNLLGKEDTDYVGLLIIGFDIADHPIDPDIRQLIEMMNLRKDGWGIYGPEIWSERNHPDCRYNCWFLGKKVSV